MISQNSREFFDPSTKVVGNAAIAPPGEPLERLIQLHFPGLLAKVFPLPRNSCFRVVFVEIRAPHNAPLVLGPPSGTDANQVIHSGTEGRRFPINDGEGLVVISKTQHDVLRKVLSVDNRPRKRSEPFQTAGIVIERRRDQPTISRL